MADLHTNISDKEKANELLNNILENCNIPPSQESLDKIMMKKKLEKKPIQILKYIAILALIISVISPLAFKSDPTFSVITTSKTVAVSSHSLYDDCFIMVLTGAADYANIYSKKNNGALIFPDKVDEASGLVIFPYNGEALNIYIPTTSGDCIQAVLNETNK